MNNINLTEQELENVSGGAIIAEARVIDCPDMPVPDITDIEVPRSTGPNGVGVPRYMPTKPRNGADGRVL